MRLGWSWVMQTGDVQRIRAKWKCGRFDAEDYFTCYVKRNYMGSTGLPYFDSSNNNKVVNTLEAVAIPVVYVDSNENITTSSGEEYIDIHFVQLNRNKIDIDIPRLAPNPNMLVPDGFSKPPLNKIDVSIATDLENETSITTELSNKAEFPYNGNLADENGNPFQIVGYDFYSDFKERSSNIRYREEDAPQPTPPDYSHFTSANAHVIDHAYWKYYSRGSDWFTRIEPYLEELPLAFAYTYEADNNLFSYGHIYFAVYRAHLFPEETTHNRGWREWYGNFTGYSLEDRFEGPVFYPYCTKKNKLLVQQSPVYEIITLSYYGWFKGSSSNYNTVRTIDGELLRPSDIGFSSLNLDNNEYLFVYRGICHYTENMDVFLDADIYGSGKSVETPLFVTPTVEETRSYNDCYVYAFIKVVYTRGSATLGNVWRQGKIIRVTSPDKSIIFDNVR